MKLTRRDLGKLAVAAIPGAELFNALRAQTSGRNSYALRAQGGDETELEMAAGVQVGMNVPYNFGSRDLAILTRRWRRPSRSEFLSAPSRCGRSPSKRFWAHRQRTDRRPKQT